VSLWDRIGGVFVSAREAAVNAPGAILNLASILSNPLGMENTHNLGLVGKAGDAFFKSSAGQATTAAAGQGLSWAERNIWSPPTDYFEASGRYATDQPASVNPENSFWEGWVKNVGGMLGGAALDPEFREEYWPEARANNSSIAQTTDELMRAGGGGPNAGFRDPATGKMVLPLIDDPALSNERLEWFDTGARKWRTGLLDASISIAADPLNVAAAGVGGAVRTATSLTGKQIHAASAASAAKRGIEKPLVRGAADTADVTSGTIHMTEAPYGAERAAGLADDPARAYLRSKLGDDGIQSLYDETVSALAVTGDKTAALSSVLDARGVSVQKVLDDARFVRGDGRLTPAGVLSSAGDDLMEKGGVRGLFEKGAGDEPFFRRFVENQDPVINRLGWNAKKYLHNTEKLTDYMWDAQGKPGSIASMADDYIMGQSSASGSVADAASWVARTVADEKTAKSLITDLQFAAAGDGAALRRVEAINRKLALDIEGVFSLDREAALEAIAVSTLKTPAEKLAIANSDDLFMRMRAEMQPELAATLEKFSRFQSSVARVQEAGTLGGVAPGGLIGTGDITKIPLIGTFQPFRSLAPVRVVGGVHLPGQLPLNDPEAVTMYSKWMDTQTKKLGLKNEGALALTRTLKDDFVAAPAYNIDEGISKGARANAAFRANRAFKQHLIHKHARRGDPEDAAKYEEDVAVWIDTALERVQAEMGALIQNARQAVESGNPNIVMDMNGHPIGLDPKMAQALGTSQFQDTVDLTDWAKMDEWLTRRYKPGYTERVVKGAAETPGAPALTKAWQATNELLEEVNDAWKVLALFRPAYPLRVQMDTQARNLATMGAGNVLNSLATGVRHAGRNSLKIDNQTYELLLRKRQAYDEGMVLLERYGENDEGLKALEKILAMDTDDWVKSGMSKAEPGSTRLRGSEFRAFRGAAEKIDRKTGAYERDPFATYRAGQSPESTLGEGVQESIEGLFKSAEAFYQKKLRKELGYNYVDYGTSALSRSAWAKGYLEAVNHGLRNDESWRRMALGQTDDEIAAWMRAPGDGSAYFKEMNRSGHFPDGVDELVGRQRAHFDNLVPQDAHDLVAARDITLDDLAEWWSGAEVTRPPVPTKIVETLKRGDRNKLYDYYDIGRSKYFKFAAQIPETMMGRHPQYHRFYQEHIDRFIASAGRTRSGEWKAGEINALRKRADLAARKDMARIMFDTSRKSEAGHHMRFMGPFYSAWEDTMFKWSTIVKEHPAAAYNTLFRPFESLTSTNNVYDKDGYRIMPNGDKRYVNEDGTLGEVVGHSANINEGYFRFTLPAGFPVIGDVDFNVSRGSLNAILQGEDWWFPGVGPMVQIPANEVVKNSFPEFEETWLGERILPFGATSESGGEQLAPAHMKNLMNWLVRGEQSESWGDAFDTAMQDEMNRQRLSGEPLSETETWDKVTNATRNLMLMKYFGSATMPGSTRPGSRLDWYRQEYRRYQSEDPKTALERFAEDHPEYLEVTISLRDNVTGVAATIEANEAADKWGKELRSNPELGWAFAGADNYKGEFSRGAYTQQVEKGWRVREDSATTFDRISIDRGWRDWTKLTNIIDVELDRRGLTSIMSNGAEDLVSLKAEAKAEIMADNPSWRDEYLADGHGADKAAAFLNKMNGALARNPKKVADRQDLQTLQQYITERESLRTVMFDYGVQSLPTEDELNQFLAGEMGGDPVRFALAQGWFEYTGALKNESPVFGDLYSRAGLERDTLQNPVVEE
jgi:hypothetical protein